MAETVSFDFVLSVRGVRRWSWVLGIAGGVAMAVFAGPAHAAGFLVGAIASWFNFQLLHAVVERLGPDPRPGSRKVISLFALRYFGLAALGYVTLRVFGSNPAAFCAGLLVAALAMLLNAIFELMYART